MNDFMEMQIINIVEKIKLEFSLNYNLVLPGQRGSMLESVILTISRLKIYT